MDVASNDERISYLEGHVPGLDDVSEPALTELKGLLASPATWAQPAPNLESAVVRAVSAAKRGGVSPAEQAHAVARRPRAMRGRVLAAIAGAATAAAAVTAVLVSNADPQPD